jgi:hypothetical protein
MPDSENGRLRRRAFPLSGRRAVALFAAFTALALLPGCKDEKKSAAESAASTAAHAREAVEQNIRASAATTTQAQFRGVQVYSQAMPQRMAVCGQVTPFADDPNIFVPFVSVVTVQGSQDGRAPQYQFEQHIGTDPSEASHVYAAIVAYCYDKGGPPVMPYQGVVPVPPLPDAIPDPLSKGGRAGQPPATATSSSPPSPPTPHVQTPQRADVPASVPGLVPDQATGSVTMRQNGNLHSEPHGPAIRVVPQGTAMRIFARASGGWYQVGDTAPWGWIHESMLDRH